jgi:hypothetical protein
LLVAVLFLSSQGFLTWLNLILLIIGLSLIEYFLISYDRSRIMKGGI